MAQTRQVLKVADESGKYSVVCHEDARVNPYYLYKHTWERNKDGYYTERKRIVVKYANLNSCLYHLSQIM